MNKKTVLVLGSDGMLGRIVYSYLKNTNKFNVLGTSRKNPDLFFLDAIKSKNLEKILRNTNFVINCIGINKVSEKNLYYANKINSQFPKKLENLSEKLNFKLIYVSTDAVFDKQAGKVTEKNLPNPKDLYGITKLKGETKSGNSITIRASIIGFSPFKKEGLIEWVINSKKQIRGYENVLWSGCTNLQFAKFCEYLISNNNFVKLKKKSNVFHFCPLGSVTKYEIIYSLLKILNKNIKLNKGKSQESVSRHLASDYFDKKFYTPYTIVLKNALKELIKFESKIKYE